MRLRAAWTIGLLLTAGAIAGCAADGERAEASRGSQEERVRYVALGDSYTIGTSVSEAERWPSQLAARIDAVEVAGNLGVNGATSADLIAGQLPQPSGQQLEPGRACRLCAHPAIDSRSRSETSVLTHCPPT